MKSNNTKIRAKSISAVMVILQTESRTQGPYYCRLRCRWGGCMHPSNTLVGKHESTTVFNVKNNLNIMEIFHLLMLDLSSGNQWMPKLEPNWTWAPEEYTIHMHTHIHETPQSISLCSYAMNLTHNSGYSYPLISDNIPPLHLDMTEWLIHT